ncbi:MAG: DUF6279 family lipoprotein [Pseudomonadota bacterium]
MLRLLFIVLLSVLAAGCSRVQFAYHQLDWLIPYYVDNYIELDGSQDSYLEAEVENLLRWHCSAHLKPYADLIRGANQEFQQGTMDALKLQFAVNRIDDYWKEIKRQASPAISRLFLTSEQSQLDDFLSGLRENNREWLTEFQAQTDEELREDYQARMTDELERWFGPLTAPQQQRIVEWSWKFKPLGIHGLQARQQWQARLRALLDRRAEEAAFFTGIEALFVDPDRGRPAQYLSKLVHNESATVEMLVDVGGQVNAQQRKHLDRMAGSVADDFDQLACAGEVLESQPAKVSYPADILLGPF